ncbi:basic phospholipase A2-like [Mercenaria mercenaria]|uniref:basic phospholipase A2-like n=1 Tax=Mercenaria mercenaria TaxID=6596 RepID=UPI001E1D6B9A|nr:basic phospholipase A2-like [Mercenaria mercenaria]
MECKSLHGTVCGSLILFLIIVSQAEGGSLVRTRRNAFQMCNLINMYTGISCLNYNPYGCFCGYGQRGSNPVDEADRCCKIHDDCYGDAHTKNHCYFWSGMFVGYTYDCKNGCRCLDQEKCARKVCECDLQLADCLGKSSFNVTYKEYDRSQCR